MGPNIQERYKRALAEAESLLSGLDIARGRPVKVKGLNGWVFEQVLRTCIDEELAGLGLTPEFEEQASLGGRSRVDLRVGTVAVEIKAAGFFGNEGGRYSRYRVRAEAKGWRYLYVTLHETYAPYVDVARQAFGADNAFFLDRYGEWGRFVARIAELLAPPVAIDAGCGGIIAPAVECTK